MFSKEQYNVLMISKDLLESREPVNVVSFIKTDTDVILPLLLDSHIPVFCRCPFIVYGRPVIVNITFTGPLRRRYLDVLICF